jgi:hypothetical protein
MDWQDEPATWKQLRYLRQCGYKPDRHLSKTAAADLITSLGGPAATTTVVAEPVIQQLPNQDAPLLRTAVEKAARAVSDARRDNLQSTQQELALAISKRQMFWIDTCRDPTRMQAACGQVLDFYRKYGCRFEAPSHRQVQVVLDALDSAMPSWERDHPELFYQTLELNFPELVRRR